MEFSDFCNYGVGNGLEEVETVRKLLGTYCNNLNEIGLEARSRRRRAE